MALEVDMSHAPEEAMMEDLVPQQNSVEDDARDLKFVALDNYDSDSAKDDENSSTISDLIEEPENYHDSQAFNVVGSSDDSENPDNPGADDRALVENSLRGPDDPHDSDPDPADSEPEDNFDDSDISYGGHQNLSIGYPHLNKCVQFLEGCSLREGVAIVTALAIRKHLDYQTLMHQFSIVNLVTGLPQFPTDKRK